MASGMAALTRAKMTRAAALLETELALLGGALREAELRDEDYAVLAEFWEQADESLVAALAVAPPLEGEAFRRFLPAPGEVTEERAGAEAEARAALRSMTSEAGWRSRPWPVDADCGERGLEGAERAVGAGTSPLPTPCRSTPQPPRAAPSLVAVASAAPVAAPCAPTAAAALAADRGQGLTPRGAASSFRTASELAPPRRPESGTDPGRAPVAAPPPDFDAVSRSVVGRKSAAPNQGGRGGATAAAGSAEGSGREWSEDWLRIADADTLDRMVPALEATIHRSGGGRDDRVVRGDIAGLGFVKDQIEEVLILPRLHPQLFASALTRPSRGLLLFGPPGTGKTLLARWIASECGATFFSINASSVLSKWIGEAEKTVKALFHLASERQPSVIFIDEIDSLLSRRRDADNESSRRVKNEFLTSLEGADTEADDKVLLVGATNMPWELDPAALRRLPKRLYVPLPGLGARRSLIKKQLAKHNERSGLQGALTAADVEAVAERSEGFSGSDLQHLLREAAMGPVREASAAIGPASRKRGAGAAFGSGSVEPRNIMMQDFQCALRRVKPSFNEDQATQHRAFNEEHGTCRGEEAMRDDDEDVDENDQAEGAGPTGVGIGAQGAVGVD